ncbi:MAG: glycosyltransferase family 4 protein [Candidatus Altiarchaeota archaeon]
MRIGFFSWETLNSVPTGGVAVVATRLAEALAAKGHEVHVFTRIGEGQPEHAEINGVHEHRCVTPGMEDFIEYMDHLGDSMVSSFHHIEGEYGKFDVLHAHDWHVVNALANIKSNKGYDNLVWTCHSTEFGRNGNHFADNWFSARIRHREWLGGYISKQVTTVSHGMKHEIMREYQIPEDKISVIYNGINIDEYAGKIDAGRVKESYGIHPFTPVVLFLGRVSYQKGPDLLMEAVPIVLRDFPSTVFVFAGTGDILDHLRGRGWWLGVQDNLRILGYVSEEDKKRLLKAADIVCVPSRNEPFGIITLEAWASGTPVVACDVGGPSEVIDNFRTGVKVHQTPESIAWGIKYLFGDTTGESIKKMAGMCVKEARKFDWSELSKKYVSVYERL